MPPLEQMRTVRQYSSAGARAPAEHRALSVLVDDAGAPADKLEGFGRELSDFRSLWGEFLGLFGDYGFLGFERGVHALILRGRYRHMIGKEPPDGSTGPGRWSRSYVQAADFFSARLDEILAALGDADAQTREAALRALVDSLRGLQSKSLDHTTADIAELYGRLFRDLHAPQHRALQIEGLLLTARILFGCG